MWTLTVVSDSKFKTSMLANFKVETSMFQRRAWLCGGRGIALTVSSSGVQPITNHLIIHPEYHRQCQVVQSVACYWCAIKLNGPKFTTTDKIKSIDDVYISMQNWVWLIPKFLNWLHVFQLFYELHLVIITFFVYNVHFLKTKKIRPNKWHCNSAR